MPRKPVCSGLKTCQSSRSKPCSRLSLVVAGVTSGRKTGVGRWAQAFKR